MFGFPCVQTFYIILRHAPHGEESIFIIDMEESPNSHLFIHDKKYGILELLELHIPISNLKPLCGMLDGNPWKRLIWTDGLHQVILPCLSSEGRRIPGVHAITDHQVSKWLSQKMGRPSNSHMTIHIPCMSFIGPTYDGPRGGQTSCNDDKYGSETSHHGCSMLQQSLTESHACLLQASSLALYGW